MVHGCSIAFRGFWEITETGHGLYQRATRVVGDVEKIDDDFANDPTEFTGLFYISVPHDFGIAFLNNVLIGFKTRHPEILLAVDFDDRTVDLAREYHDFAIRITPEPESGVSSERIGTVHHRPYASPQYVQAHSDPQSPGDLRQHPLLHFRTARRAVWGLVTVKGKEHSFEFQPFLNSNSGAFLLEATLKGLGIVRLPDFAASQALAAGRLVPVLTGMTIPDLGIYLVHVETRRINGRMRLSAKEVKQACLSTPKG